MGYGKVECSGSRGIVSGLSIVPVVYRHQLITSGRWRVKRRECYQISIVCIRVVRNLAYLLPGHPLPTIYIPAVVCSDNLSSYPRSCRGSRAHQEIFIRSCWIGPSGIIKKIKPYVTRNRDLIGIIWICRTYLKCVRVDINHAGSPTNCVFART